MERRKMEWENIFSTAMDIFIIIILFNCIQMQKNQLYLSNNQSKINN